MQAHPARCPKAAAVLCPARIPFGRRAARVPARRAGVSLDSVGVGDLASEHLESAADPQHCATRTGVIDDGAVEAARPQPLEVGEGGSGARQDHDVGIRKSPRIVDETDPHIGFEAERVDVGEVADTGTITTAMVRHRRRRVRVAR